MKECFWQSAGRHLDDALLLHDQHRYDNAVYLAGYVAECTLKTLVEVHMGKAVAEGYKHQIEKLEGKGLDRLRTIYPFLDLMLPRSSTAGTVLAKNHPERRYATSGKWTHEESEAAVLRAKEIYEQVIPGLLLDGLLGE